MLFDFDPAKLVRAHYQHVTSAQTDQGVEGIYEVSRFSSTEIRFAVLGLFFWARKNGLLEPFEKNGRL